MIRRVIVHYEDEMYWIECPSLPGCYSQGETKEIALENMKEAIQLHIESLQEAGDPIPEDDFEFATLEI